MDRLIFPCAYFPFFDNGRPISDGYIYVGEPLTDPEVVGNQINVFIKDEQAQIVQISQPIRTGAGGVPIYNGSPAFLTVEESYSLKVLDVNGQQIYYFPEILVLPGTEPVAVIGLLTSNLNPVYTNDGKRVVLRA